MWWTVILNARPSPPNLYTTGDESELVKVEVGIRIVSRQCVVCLIVCVGLLVEIGDRTDVDVSRGVDSLRECTLPFIRVKGNPEGATTVDSLLDDFGHPLKIDGELQVDADEVTLMSIPLISAEEIGRGIHDDSIPSLGVVALELG